MLFSKLLATFAGTLLLTPSAKVNGVTQFALLSYRISPERNGINISFQPFLTSDATTSDVTTSGVTQFHVKSGANDEHYVGTTENAKQTLNVLIHNGEIAVGSIVDEEDGNVYKLWRSESGDLLVTETHTSEFPDELDAVDNEVPIRHLREKDSTSFQERNLQECPVHVIDVLAPWTAEAECKQSNLENDCTRTAATAKNIKNLIQLAVDETNTAYKNSGVKVNGEVARLNLVHAYYEPSINEDLGFNGVLEYIAGSSQIASKRTQYGADVVASITGLTQYCGIAYLGPNKNSMFSVTTTSCATGYYSFGHEIGHNMGANHDRGTSGACSSLNYNYGFRDPSGGFRSILAYNCATGQCDNISKSSCTRVQRFSNNDTLYNNKAIGSKVADNARQHSEQFATVSGYYACKVPTDTPTDAPTNAPTDATTDAPTEMPTSSSTGNPTTSPTVTPTSSPTVTHTVSPTVTPTESPTGKPTSSPTGNPTTSPTVKPTSSPTGVPTASPIVTLTASPTGKPTSSPTVNPTNSQTVTPTSSPTLTQTKSPTVTPTASPTRKPTSSPTRNPTASQTVTPTSSPTIPNTTYPSMTPTTSPTGKPTSSPTGSPTISRTVTPTSSPTAAHTTSPTVIPTVSPTGKPTSSPTGNPTNSPTVTPTSSPTGVPTASPTVTPTATLTGNPTSSPTGKPTNSPTVTPTSSPTGVPTTSPTVTPTASPTGKPTSSPTESPTTSPTRMSTTGSPAQTPGPTVSPTYSRTWKGCNQEAKEMHQKQMRKIKAERKNRDDICPKAWKAKQKCKRKSMQIFRKAISAENAANRNRYKACKTLYKWK